MAGIAEIQQPIQKELEQFEKHFKSIMLSDKALLDKITHYIVKRKGKQMRPMFVLLASNLAGKINERTYRAASLIEMVHTASLVHDDIVDDAMERRSFFSVNALWKNKIAVLVGDYLLARALQLSAEFKDYDFLEIISDATKQMSEGELLQIEKARRLDIKEEIYFEIIRQKTATLIAACFAVGASSNNCSDEEVKHLHKVGELIGIAFQIKDDLFDYEPSAKSIGKPVGIDIKEKKMTLPLIYTLNNSDKKQKKWIINVVKNKNEDAKEVQKLIDLVKRSGGMEYTTEKMLEYRDMAVEALNKYPDSASKKSLIELINYTISRTK